MYNTCKYQLCNDKTKANKMSYDKVYDICESVNRNARALPNVRYKGGIVYALKSGEYGIRFINEYTGACEGWK